jgi:hypothetical protein
MAAIYPKMRNIIQIKEGKIKRKRKNKGSFFINKIDRNKKEIETNMLNRYRRKITADLLLL